MASDKKETNPKDAVGIAKVPWSTVPFRVIAEVGLAMLEGALKYGRHNYRSAGVRASVYFDAVNRHIGQWWEGQDIDPDSGLSHITKAIASLVVLRDSMLQGNWVDDRPPKVSDDEWIKVLNAKAKALLERYPNPMPAHTELGRPKPPAEEAPLPLVLPLPYTFKPGDIVESIGNVAWTGPMVVVSLSPWGLVSCKHPRHDYGSFRTDDLRLIKSA